jgi:hypothetical protein
MFDENGQLHTLEGVAASTLILLVIIYAIDATSMTPLTSSTSNVHIETELLVLGQDILNNLDYSDPGYNSNLTNDILNWDGGTYILSDGKNYYIGGNTSTPPLNNSITYILYSTLVKKGIAHKVEFTYLDNNGTSFSTDSMIDNGNPSDNAVIVSRKIVLQNLQNSVAPSGYPIPDIDPSTNFYNIVLIKLYLWRT